MNINKRQAKLIAEIVLNDGEIPDKHNACDLPLARDFLLVNKWVYNISGPGDKYGVSFALLGLGENMMKRSTKRRIVKMIMNMQKKPIYFFDYLTSLAGIFQTVLSIITFWFALSIKYGFWFFWL